MIIAANSPILNRIAYAAVQKDFKPVTTSTGTVERKTIKDSNAVITRYTFSKPISSFFGEITGAEIVKQGNYEYFNAYIGGSKAISCITSIDGRVFLKNCGDKEFNGTKFMDLMNSVANRMLKINKEANAINKTFNLNGLSANMQKAIDDDENDCVNKTGGPVSVRSVLTDEKNASKNGSETVNWYTISANGKFASSKMLINSALSKGMTKQVVFTIPKVEGDKEFYYEFELVGNKPDSNTVKVHHNTNKVNTKSISGSGYHYIYDETTVEKDYNFTSDEIMKIVALIQSIEQTERRREYKELLKTIRYGVIDITPKG